LAEAFYLPTDGGFEPTELTRGPWDPGAQHAGPPAALLGRATDQAGRPELRTARITLDILRPVPIAPLEIATRVLRGGRSVELVEAVMRAAGEEVVRAVALRLRRAPVTLPDGLDSLDGGGPPPPGPEHGEQRPFFPTAAEVGYHTGMEWRFVTGSFLDPGPATVWLRMRHPLLPDEAPSPLTRVLIAADSGNGVSAVLDWRRFLFINADLTVHLHREPVGEWVCLVARTTVEADGGGLAETAIHDAAGPVARGLQTLFVADR
jgi:Thioesterase-like superfamily